MKLTDSADSAAQAMAQWLEFRNMQGRFASDHVRKAAKTMLVHEWWQLYGRGTILGKLATKITAQPASSSASEGNWSKYEWIHSKRRNRLTTKRAEDLVWVHTTLQLRERMQRLNMSSQRDPVPWRKEEDSEAELTEAEEQDNEPEEDVQV